MLLGTFRGQGGELVCEKLQLMDEGSQSARTW